MKILKFGATWCPGCVVMGPRLEEIKTQNPDIEIEMIDTDQNPELAEKYDVRDLPTLVYLDKNGVELEKQHGILPKEKINEAISRYRD
ncbi:MAG: thioredoxin family protein [Patescibacteria group bacterium]